MGVGILFMSAVLWLPNRHHMDLFWEIWLFRIIGLPLSMGLLIYSFRKPQKDILPDYLRTSFKERCVWERAGLSFVVGYLLRDGVFYLLVYYQNRFDRMCVATINLNGVPRFMQVKSDLEPVTLPLRIGGGEYGAAIIPYPVPADRRGKQVLFNVSADVNYPAGNGNLLRFKPGFNVGRIKKRQSWIRAVLGQRVKIPIPKEAPDVIPAGAKIEVDILDQRNLSSGFEVIPIAKMVENQKQKSS
jgi:hypothetical protein